MTKRLRVREGNTGILYLSDAAGNEERYIPDYDLDKARELLLEFEDLRDDKGCLIRDSYRRDGYNWFPTTVNLIHGRIFFNYVKYKPLIDKFIDGNVKFVFQNKGEFHRIVAVIKGKPEGNFFKKRVFNWILRLNNWSVIRECSAELLFFRFSPNEFTTAKAKKVLDELQINYIEVLAPYRKLLLSNLIRRRPYYFFGGLAFKNIFGRSYRIEGGDSYKRVLFAMAVRRIEETMSSFVMEYRRHCAAMKGKNFKTFYGIDDTQIVYPILYACQHLGIKTITHQHGAAYNKRHASYVMEGIEKDSYQWFERIIVWGKYWKHMLLDNSKVYSDDMFIEGASLYEFDYSHGGEVRSHPRNILVPYEFLTNTYKLGQYVMKFIDLGYNVYFKPRPDEDLRDQLDAYCLGEGYRARINIVEKITPHFMETIDIVAGTMTTLVYQLLPYSKIVWILDTEVGYLDHLVEEGLARKVRYEDLENLDETYFRRTHVRAEDFFNPESLEVTLRKHVLGYLSQHAGQGAEKNETVSSIELPREATSR